MQPFDPPDAAPPKPMASAKNARVGVGTGWPDVQVGGEASAPVSGEIASGREPLSVSELPSGAESSCPRPASPAGRSPSTTSLLAPQPEKRLKTTRPTTSRRADTTALRFSHQRLQPFGVRAVRIQSLKTLGE